MTTGYPTRKLNFSRGRIVYISSRYRTSKKFHTYRTLNSQWMQTSNVWGLHAINKFTPLIPKRIFCWRSWPTQKSTNSPKKKIPKPTSVLHLKGQQTKISTSHARNSRLFKVMESYKLKIYLGNRLVSDLERSQEPKAISLPLPIFVICIQNRIINTKQDESLTLKVPQVAKMRQ